MRALLLALLLPAGLATAAPSRAVVVVRAPELSLAQKHALADAAFKALASRTSFEVTAAPVPTTPSEGSPCRDDACALALARAHGAEIALILDASLPELDFELHAAFVDVRSATVAARTTRGGNPDRPAGAVDLLLRGVLPGWAKKGFASVAIDAPPNAVVKIDGVRVGLTPLLEPLGVPAGEHEIDVLFDSGQGALWRRRLEEGGRVTLQARPSEALEAWGQPREKSGALRPVSYGLWSAGAVAIAASLVAGGLARGTTDDLAGCTGTSRDCLRLEQAQAVHRRAEGYARTGNVLLVSGAVLGVAGAGLFVFDLAELGR